MEIDPLPLSIKQWDQIPTLEEAASARSSTGRLNPPPPPPPFNYTPLTGEQHHRIDTIERAFVRCVGSGHFYRHALMRSVLYTEGVEYLCKQAGAYWLVDLIASWQLVKEVKQEEFQLWQLLVCNTPPPGPGPYPGPGASIAECSDTWAWAWMEDGHNTDRSVKAVQFIPFTDMLLGRWPHPKHAADPRKISHEERNTHHRCALKLYAERNNQGGVTIMLPSER